MLIPQIVTASFDANLAKIVGIPAAILYNKLSWLSQTDMAKDYDPDGWFYYTMNDFCEATGYTKNVYTKAAQTLVDNGFIEKNKRFVSGTAKPCNHYRMLKYWELMQNEGNASTPNVTTAITPNGKTIISNKISKNSRNPGDATTDATASSVADYPSEEGGNFSSMSEKDERSEVRGEAQGLSEKGGLTNDPFSVPVKDGVVSLKPDGKKKQSTEDVHAWAVTNQVTKIIREAGHVCPDNNIRLKSAIMAHQKNGVSDADIIKVANIYANETRAFYRPGDRSPHSAFSADYFYQYLNNDSQQKNESIFGRN